MAFLLIEFLLNFLLVASTRCGIRVLQAEVLKKKIFQSLAIYVTRFQFSLLCRALVGKLQMLHSYGSNILNTGILST